MWYNTNVIKTDLKDKKMDNKKIPTIVGTFIIIVIAITVGVFVWKIEKNQKGVGQSQNVVGIKKLQKPTANQRDQAQQLQAAKGSNDEMKKYINKTFGFEFEFPSDLVITQNSTDSVFGLSDKPDGHWAYNVTVTANVNNISLDQAFDSALERYKNTDKKIIVTNINIGGEQAKKYSIQNPTDSGNSVSVVIYEKNIITIYGDDSTPSNKTNFIKLLSSFKFIK